MIRGSAFDSSTTNLIASSVCASNLFICLWPMQVPEERSIHSLFFLPFRVYFRTRSPFEISSCKMTRLMLTGLSKDMTNSDPVPDVCCSGLPYWRVISLPSASTWRTSASGISPLSSITNPSSIFVFLPTLVSYFVSSSGRVNIMLSCPAVQNQPPWKERFQRRVKSDSPGHQNGAKGSPFKPFITRVPSALVVESAVDQHG